MYYVVNLKKLLVFSLVIILSVGVCVSGNRIIATFKVGDREIPIYSVERDDNKIALTFNCAWNDEDIDDIIETLKRYNVGATFFAVGDWAEKYPESLKKLSDNGFEIGNHSYNHAHYNKMTKDKILADIEKGDSVIENIIGKPIYLFRAAYGEYNDNVITACDESERVYIQWSVDSLDYKAKSPNEICERVMNKVSDGDIILMHNGTDCTAEALKTLIPSLLEEHTLVSVSDLIYKDNYIIDGTGRQKIIK